MKMLQPNGLNYIEHASDVIAKAAAFVAENRPFALIVSLEIEGGAAREVGSLALVDAIGEMTGYLSNGCIDQDIRHHALEALGSGVKKLIRYGDGSRYVDLKLPCGGALSVLIDPAPDLDAIRDAAAKLGARQPVSMMFESPGESDPQMRRTFAYEPRNRLVLAGRGAVFRSLVLMGNATGYEVYALSPDTADLAAIAPVLHAEPVHLTSPNVERSLEMLDAYSAFLTLFHDHDWEPALLKAALDTPAHFIGSLGSRRTHALRKENLRHMGVPEASLERLRGPIGLVPSLRDASSIAVSALAEIVSVFKSEPRANA
jgi:xanthine dehydrogenase accessory factor